VKTSNLTQLHFLQSPPLLFSFLFLPAK
jgi:hypothetical protein